MLAWLALALASTAYVAWDQFRGNPEPAVMKWGFVLTTLYMGPIGLLIYVLADKEPRPGTHREFVSPLWKQGLGSTIHCVAGDATGIILAAAATAALGLPMGVDLVVEYIAGFTFGLLIFQSLFMKAMMGGSYFDNVRRTFVPELISMNAMMAGMAPVMSFLMMGREMRAMWPGEPLFWAVMSLGVIVGFFIAYPANIWMVAKGLKHGLMTQSDEERKQPKWEREEARPKQPAHAYAGISNGHRSSSATDRRPIRSEEHAHSDRGRSSSEHDGARKGHGGHQDQGHGAHGGGDLPPAFAPTFAQQAAMAGATTLMLLAGMIVPGFYVNLGLSAHDVGDASRHDHGFRHTRGQHAIHVSGASKARQLRRAGGSARRPVAGATHRRRRKGLQYRGIGHPLEHPALGER